MMKRFVAVVALLGLLGLASARSFTLPRPMHRTSRTSLLEIDPVPTTRITSTEDVVNFLKGMAVGLETELGDPTACAKELSNITSDLKDAYEHLYSGIKKKSVKDVAIGLILLGDAFEKSAKAFKDCGVERAYEDIMKIVLEIRSGNIKTFIHDELLHIWADRKELIHIVTDAANSWQTKNYFQCGEDSGELIAILIDVKSDLSMTPADAVELLKGVAIGMGATMGDPSACVRDLDIMVADFNSAWQDMKNGIRRLDVRVIKRAIQEFADGINVVADSLGACGLEEAETQIKSIVAQIKAGKLLEVIVQEAAHIICHRGELTTYFKNAADSWKAGQFNTSGQNIGKIIGELITIPPSKN